MQAGERRASQESRVSAEDRPDEILESGLVDGGAGELERDALESIHNGQGNRDKACPVIDTKRDPRRDHRRDRKDALAKGSIRVLHSQPGPSSWICRGVSPWYFP